MRPSAIVLNVDAMLRALRPGRPRRICGDRNPVRSAAARRPPRSWSSS